KAWVEWNDKYHDNFHLLPDEIDRTGKVGMGEDMRFASICNASFPMDCCCIHAGQEGWGAEGEVLYDLQIRYYEIPSSIDHVRERILGAGVQDCKRLAQCDPPVKCSEKPPWHFIALRFPGPYDDLVFIQHMLFGLQQTG